MYLRGKVSEGALILSHTVDGKIVALWDVNSNGSIDNVDKLGPVTVVEKIWGSGTSNRISESTVFTIQGQHVKLLYQAIMRVIAGLKVLDNGHLILLLTRNSVR